MAKIIIHFPFKINRDRAAASQLRPIKIIETFEAMGYDVCLIEGYGKDRKKQINNIKKAILSGEKFDFVYSESNTSPTLLTEKHHYPTYPFLDFSFFKFCKKNNVKIGLFYRDIYWCFPENNHGIIRKLMLLFYKYDLYNYNKYVSTLYVPSYDMVKYIPYKLKMPISELYPGCIKYSRRDVNENRDKIKILYVGGIGCHYDISMIMDVVKDQPFVNLTICCRPDDWESAKSYFLPFVGDNMTIVHKSGNELNALYEDADLFCLFVKPNKYWEFAVPFKLFETIGHGCPILSTEGLWVSKFVDRYGIGFTCGFDKESLKQLFRYLQTNRKELLKVKEQVSLIIDDNTWETRCRNIVSDLT